MIFVIFISIFILVKGWNIISKSDTYRQFNEFYNVFTSQIVISIGGVFGTEIEYQAETKLLTTEKKSAKLILPIDSYKYFFAGFILLIIVPIRLWKSSISAILFVLLFISFRASIISYILLMLKGTVHNVLLVWIDPTIYIAMFILGLYIMQNNDMLSRLYLNLQNRFSEVLTVSLSTLLFLLIVIPPLPRVFFTYIHSDIMPGIVSFILHISQFFMHLIGKTTEVTGRFITCGRSCIDLEYPCLGLGVFSLVAVLILATKGKFANKTIYLLAFAIVYLVLNALRLSALLLYLHITAKDELLDYVTLHNIVTYFMYMVAFGGFLVYWFAIGRNAK